MELPLRETVYELLKYHYGWDGNSPESTSLLDLDCVQYIEESPLYMIVGGDTDIYDDDLEYRIEQGELVTVEDLITHLEQFEEE